MNEKQKIYDEMCRVLTDWETQEAVDDDLYNMLVKIQNNWETVITKQEDQEMIKETKKYTIKDCEEFCQNVLVMPPLDEFLGGVINEQQWYEDHKIHIVVDNHIMELEYNADNVTEIDCAIKEMYETEMNLRDATIGNEYRVAELKDIIRVAVQHDWDNWGWQSSDFGEFIREFIKRYDDIANIFGVYDIIYESIDDYTERFKCDFSKLDMHSLRCLDRVTIKSAIEELIGTEVELLLGFDYENRCSDITFVMDNTLKPSGELIGWFYGEADDEYIKDLITDYTKKLFGEEKV